MVDRLDELLRFQTEALRLRSQRQALLAANIANADTPNYKAVDFDFARALADATATPPPRGGTDAPAASAGPALLYRQPRQASLDGNSVEMEAERAHFADNTVRFEATLRFLNAQLKLMLSAIQG
jgi:flagellar basal-body rod protein FlgB